ncbi:hypothetical protein [Gemmobacter sp.]|uniref:hypothetical protein n=1 Tax=Gemmobacter sp. TaxID=1898957 RepID=UPI00391C6111
MVLVGLGALAWLLVALQACTRPPGPGASRRWLLLVATGVPLLGLLTLLLGGLAGLAGLAAGTLMLSMHRLPGPRSQPRTE